MAAKVLNESLYLHRIDGKRIKSQVRRALLHSFFTYLEAHGRTAITQQDIYRVLFYLSSILEEEGPALLTNASQCSSVKSELTVERCEMPTTF